MRNQQGGFTLIELVMVIVILGILAAFALPKFANLTDDARRAQIQGAAGSIKSASAIVHASYLAAGNNPNTIALEGQNITLINGYPMARNGGNSILGAAGITTGNQGDFNVDTSGQGTGAGAVIVVQAKGATDPATCSVSYTAPDVGQAPTVTVTTTGC